MGSLGRSARAALVVATLALGAAGCGGDEGATGTLKGILGTASKKATCPSAVVVSDARHLYDFAAGGGSAADVRVAVRITIPAARCKIEGGRALVDLDVPIDAARGPGLRKGRLEVEFPYFVAVADRFDNILAKEVFTASVRIGGDQERTSTVEAIQQVIPLADGQDGSHFVIYVGFQLTPEQVEFNRRNRL
jgi:hypothetical protein